MTYGVVHKPLIIGVKRNNRFPDRMIGFIRGQICFFEQDVPQPNYGRNVEIMITRPMYSVFPEDHERAGQLNYSRLRSIMIAPVDPSKHMLIAISGMYHTVDSRSITIGCETDGARILTHDEVIASPTLMTITPGRTGIIEVDCKNTSVTDPVNNANPTNVWVKRDEVAAALNSGAAVRIAGLTRVRDAFWSEAVSYRWKTN